MTIRRHNLLAKDASLDAAFDVYTASILELPFRIQLNTPYVFAIGDKLVYCRNEVAYPKGADMFELSGEPKFAHTDVIVMTPFRMDAQTKGAFARSWPNPDGKSFPPESVEFFNEFIVAYLFSVDAGARTLPYGEFISCTAYEGQYVVPEGRHPGIDDCVYIWESRPVTDTSICSGGVGYGADVDTQAIDRAIKDYYARGRKYMFYELEKAASLYLGAEPKLGLLFSVMALESAVGVLFEDAIAKLVDEVPDASAWLFNKISSWRLQERLTVLPTLCLAPAQRPTSAEIQAARAAITIRNDIMHSSRDGTGYKIRKRTRKDLKKGFHDAMVVYSKLRDAIEKRDRGDQP